MKNCEFRKNSENFRKFWQILAIFLKKCDFRAVQRSALCRSRRELSNEYLLEKFGFDTAENEPCKVCPLSAYRSPRFVIMACCVRLIVATSTGPRRSGGDVRERRLAKFRQNVTCFRLYRLRFLQLNMRFAAFFKIYQIIKLKCLKFDKILQILRHLQNFC